MKTNFFTRLFLLALVSFSLYSCTADSVDDTKSQSEVTPTKPQIPTNVTTTIEPEHPKPRI